MRKAAIAAIGLLSIAVVTFAKPPQIGEPARPFSLQTAAGSTVSLKDYHGKSKVVLVFYRGYW